MEQKLPMDVEEHWCQANMSSLLFIVSGRIFMQPISKYFHQTLDSLQNCIWKVVLGVHNRYDLSTTGLEKHVVVAKIIRYTRPGGGIRNDIAVIELMEEVDISIYAPACLAGKSETFTGVHAWTYGKFLYKTLNTTASNCISHYYFLCIP